MCLNLGSVLPGSILRQSVAVAEALEMGHWLKASSFSCKKLAANRQEIFRLIAGAVADRRVLYLEFGVWQGASMRLWSSLLKNSASKLHGFDSFEGLPEGWIEGYSKGHFSTDGLEPSIPDPRVRFYKGWFQNTLPSYTLLDHDVLVVSIDCDLYQPARFVLDFLGPYIRTGDFLYFDEFHLPQHEGRAFREFINANRNLDFSLVGATSGFTEVAFRCTRH
jgi:hypothetical protein